MLQSAAELVAIPSVSGNEKAIADHVEAKLRKAPWLEVARVADNVVARTSLAKPERVVLAGHLDTVPGDQPASVRGATLSGLGAVDMKGGIAVMLDLALSLPEPRYDLTYVFYACEEVERERNGLLQLPAELLEGSAAIVCEPTGCVVEAGCQGVLKAVVSLAGRRAHVARPWAGDNALHRLGPLLCALASWVPREPEVDGCRYRESLQAVRAKAGVASNVLPDRAELELNYRFAPDRDKDGAVGALREIVAGSLEGRDSFAVTDFAPAAPPSLHHPLISALVAASEAPARAKLGWTDVAFFAERGVPAANFGPGEPELAHTPYEQLSLSSLERARRVLGRLLGEVLSS